MEFYGKVIEVLPERTGTSARGEWTSQEYVVESKPSDHGYVRRLVFSVFGKDRIDRFKIAKEQWVTVYFDVDSRRGSKGDSWFLSATAYDVRLDPANGNAPGADGSANAQQPNTAGQQQPNTANGQQPNVAASEQDPFAGGPNDELPFG